MRLISEARAFSAALTPAGIYLVAYRMSGGGLEETDYAQDLTGWSDPVQAARALGRMIEGRGGRGATLDLAVSGFGSYQQILALPPASRDVLLPVVYRELRRFFPPVFAGADTVPVVDYATIGVSDGAPGVPDAAPQAHLLAAAVPRPLIETIRGELLAREISLRHWTVVPRVMQRLYGSFVQGEAATAVIVMADGLALHGFFEAGKLRLFSEASAQGADGDIGAAVVQRIERGALYLRQQFRAARIERVLISSSDPDEASRVASAAAERLEADVRDLGPYGAAPGALLALGAGLDAVAADPLQLLPPDLRPARARDRITRFAVAVSLAIVLAASAWWAWTGVRAERHAAERFQQAAAALEDRASDLSRVREVVEARQAHAQRAELLRQLLGTRYRIPQVLWPVARGETGVRIETVQVSPRRGGWGVTLEGTATGASSAASANAVDRFFETLGEELPDADVSLDRMAPLEPGGTGAPGGERWLEAADLDGPIATTFRMSFIVPAMSGVNQ